MAPEDPVEFAALMSLQEEEVTPRSVGIGWAGDRVGGVRLEPGASAVRPVGAGLIGSWPVAMVDCGLSVTRTRFCAIRCVVAGVGGTDIEAQRG